MINDAQNTIFENMKKRLTNPFLFTYFWVFVSWNINKILVLMYEPMKMSDKLKMYEGQWSIALPFLFAFFMVTLFSYLDVFVDFVKRNADSFNKKVLVKFDFEKIVTTSEYEDVVKQRNLLRRELSEAQDLLIKSKAQEVKTDNSDAKSIVKDSKNLAASHSSKKRVINPFQPVEVIELDEIESNFLLELSKTSGQIAELRRQGLNIEIIVGQHKIVTWNADKPTSEFWLNAITHLESLGLIVITDEEILQLTEKGNKYLKVKYVN